MHKTETSPANKSADELLQGFKIKVTGNIVWAGAIIELVLALAQFVIGNHILASIILGASVLFGIVAWYYRGQRIPLPFRIVFITLLASITAVSMHFNAYLGVYWTYPLLTACFFLFSGTAGIIAAASLVVVFGGTAAFSLPLDDAWRLTATLTIILVLGSVFVVLLRQLQELLRQLVVTDTLTGLNNRHLVTAVLEDALSRWQRYQRPASVIIIDLDHFKPLNDKYGHLFGDQILKQVAKRLRAVLRKNDDIFRVGGEEFLILLPETNEDAAMVVAHKLRDLIAEQPFKGKQHEVTVTISLGVAQVAAKQSWAEWLNAADQALLKAKREGRNRVCSASTR
ncbi:GGDEF domain-containing protein [Pseudidiomarina atlantica]|jgi:diguanylate cyclase (GGDEF)-like protein|uniref:GGDEF domain-containing protein n=1 Tax=Pseudidiomarina atlantica TaxID=1517416 RepID=UPI00068D48CC|nr:GGDEF domain-containing protein [Pseudidiomarina atlantica]